MEKTIEYPPKTLEMGIGSPYPKSLNYVLGYDKNNEMFWLETRGTREDTPPSRWPMISHYSGIIFHFLDFKKEGNIHGGQLISDFRFDESVENILEHYQQELIKNAVNMRNIIIKRHDQVEVARQILEDRLE